ncbi:MAG: PTS sugar transporter subunit IIA, partial [Gammaproteobacteria bacterium]
IAAFMQLQYGIEYDAVDQAPVDLLFALLVPEDSTDEHLQILSDLAEMFSVTETLERLRAGSTIVGIFKILTE